MSYYATTHYLQRVYSTFCLMNKWCKGINGVPTSFFRLNSSLFKTIYIKKWNTINRRNPTMKLSLCFKDKKNIELSCFSGCTFSSKQYKTVQHKSKSIRKVQWNGEERIDCELHTLKEEVPGLKRVCLWHHGQHHLYLCRQRTEWSGPTTMTQLKD